MSYGFRHMVFHAGKEGHTEGLVTAVKQLGGTMETAIQQLVDLYDLSESDAREKVKLYW